ncbi:MAG: tetratricopeptide repeat protein [Candidatus Pacebacteria bacterium]|nr:tetratricopeptide repeat protein [Candidatus Paceibacterota bacterium]
MILNSSATQTLEIGNYYFNVGGEGVYDLERAEFYFEKALEIDPEVPDAWHQLARIDFLRGHFVGALYKINKQIEVHGDGLMSSYYIRGLILGYMGRYDEAEKDFLTFLAWDPENWAIYNDLSWVYFSEGQYGRSAEYARKGVELHPNNPWLLNMFGMSLVNLGQREEGHVVLHEAYDRAQELTESDWHKAYPGNDPRVAREGLQNILDTISRNLTLSE